MNILMICEFYDDALEYQENLLAKYYTANGHDVTIVTSTIRSIQDYYHDRDAGKGERQDEQTVDARIIRLPFRFNLLHRIKIFEPLTPIIEEIQPDLLYFHDIIPNITEGARYARRHPECRMIMDYHADISNSGVNWISRRILHGIVRKWFLDRARPYLQRIFPIVPAGADFLRQYYGVTDAEMTLLPLGTDQKLASQILASDSRERIRQSIKARPSDLVIFTGGKLTPLKQTEAVIAAVNQIASPHIHLIVIGSADSNQAEYHQGLKSMAAVNPNCHLMGWQDRTGVYEYMSACELAIFPASQSVLWQQSLGMGLPIVVSEEVQGRRGVQSVGYLNRNDNLIVLDPDLPLIDQIARHIRKFDTNRSALAAMADGARKTATEILDYESLIAMTFASS